MGIVIEILFELFGVLLQVILDTLAQAVFEIAAEIGLRSLAEPFRRSRPINPFLAGAGYLLYGAIAGGLSLLIPKMFTVSLSLRILNLVITPVACGFIMTRLGKIRERREKKTIRIDTFFYGYIFALAMAIVRFIWR
jgi:hypothetical protein